MLRRQSDEGAFVLRCASINPAIRCRSCGTVSAVRIFPPPRLLIQEPRGQQGQGLVVVPRRPVPHLVVGQGRKVRFTPVTELIRLLLEAREERQQLRLRQQLGKLDLLILDELGYVPASKAGAELLFDVIATAYERYSLIVTTNLPFENWPEVLGSERLTGAALDRLTHRSRILETKGESYRLQDAKRHRRRLD